MKYYKLVESLNLEGEPIMESVGADEEIDKLRWDAYAEGRADEKREQEAKRGVPTNRS